ncbi:MAG: hypothetical protein JWN02_1490, partial [Acidobacteria bacterium]|nr:hypothetical protein [Acidobacteriota bacterium]
MPRRRLLLFPALLLLLTAASALEAQSDAADLGLSITLEASGNQPDRAGIGDDVTFRVTFGNDGPAPAHDVAIDLDVPGEIANVSAFGDGFTCTQSRPLRCTASSLLPRLWYTPFIMVHTKLPLTAGPVTAQASIHSASSDPNPGNNAVRIDVQVVDQTDLRAAVTRFYTQVDPGQVTNFAAEAINTSLTPARDVVLKVTLPNGGTITRFSFRTRSTGDCSFTADELTCRMATLAAKDYVGIDVFFAAPQRLTGGEVVMHAEVTSAGEDFAPGDNADSKSVVLVRNFVVDNTSDAGSGSLRQAIEDARGLCTSSPCTVVFHIPGPVPASGWFTIRPLSSLPEARGYLHINGSTQTTFTGDTNAEGPEIEISGALAGDASGLTLNTGCDLEVKGLAINGFARDGIDVIAPPYGVSCGRAATITESYLGTDPRGRTAIPNERGIVAAGLVTIGNNLIAGNRRSGIFCNGPGYALISENRIGI